MDTKDTCPLASASAASPRHQTRSKIAAVGALALSALVLTALPAGAQPAAP